MKLTLHNALLIVAALVIALFADAWHSARHDSQQLAATVAAQNGTIEQAASREKQRDSQLAAALAASEEKKRQIHTPQQAAKHLPEVLPPLPLPISIHIPTSLSPPAPEEVPAASISVPEPDLVPLYDGLQDCRDGALQNAALQDDLSDERARSSALTRERDAAIVASRGGAFLVRMKRAAKWFAIGAVSGAAIAAVTRR